MAATATAKPIDILDVYLPLYGLPQRYKVVYGGRRSGKSVSVSQLLVRQGVENPGRRTVVMRKVGTTIRLSTWNRYRAALSETLGPRGFAENKSDRELSLPNGSLFNFLGADDPEKLKSIEGVTDYHLEETNELKESDFDVLDAGLSANVDPLPSIWMTFNPVPIIQGFQHWLQTRFLQIEHTLGKVAIRGEVAVLRTFFLHNPFCPEKIRDLFFRYRETNPDLWKMWGLGLFTALKGAILTDWDVRPSVPPGIPFMGYGLDFGYASDEAAVVAVWKKGDDMWLQQRVYGTGLTDPQLSKEMELAGMRKGFDDIVADSAEPKAIATLKNLGWTIRGSEKGQDYKRSAARYLQAHHIHILEDSPDLQKEAATWCWKLAPDGETALPIVADGNDHLIDSTIYRVYRPGSLLTPEQIAGVRTSRAPAITGGRRVVTPLGGNGNGR